jgi:PEP-CTERM motif
MRRLTLGLVALGCVALLATVARANLLLNGELTTPAGNNEAADNWSKSEPTLDGSGGPIDSLRFQKSTFADHNDSTVPLSDNPGPDGDPNTNDLGGMWFRGFLGNNSSNPNIFVDASAWQDVAAGPGKYALSFWEKQEFYFQAVGAGVRLDYFGAGMTPLGSSATLDLLATPGTNTDSALVEPWAPRMLMDIAPAGTETIRVLAFMEDGSDNPATVTFKPQSLLLDGFDLRAVPEPGTITLLCLGALGLLGIKRRNR